MSPATSAVISGRPQIDMKKRATSLAERDRERRDGLLVSLKAQRAVDGRHFGDPRLGEQKRLRPLELGRAEPKTGRRGGQQIVKPALVDDPPLADDRDPVAELLDLG